MFAAATLLMTVLGAERVLELGMLEFRSIVEDLVVGRDMPFDRCMTLGRVDA